MASKVGECFTAVCAYLSVIKCHKTVSPTAERARVFLLQNDYALAVQTDLERIARLNVQSAAYFFRNDDTAKIIQLSYNTGCFHCRVTSCYFIWEM